MRPFVFPQGSDVYTWRSEPWRDRHILSVEHGGWRGVRTFDGLPPERWGSVVFAARYIDPLLSRLDEVALEELLATARSEGEA